VRLLRAALVAVAVAAVLYVMLDSGATGPPAPEAASLSLGALSLLFGLGAWATSVAGQGARAPLLGGLAIGTGGYALLRLVLV
jgi:hypothetical protein